MPKQGTPGGRFIVSGHGHEDHPAPSVGAGISCAQDFARIDRHVSEERTYYVRDLAGLLFAMVTKDIDGIVHTTAIINDQSDGLLSAMVTKHIAA